MRSHQNEISDKLCYTELVYDRINRKLGLHLSSQEKESLVPDIVERTDEKHFLKKKELLYHQRNQGHSHHRQLFHIQSNYCR